MSALPKKNLTLGHSPDADDAFMFYAMTKGKIPTGNLEFTHLLKDIQTLNDWALEGRLHITAASLFAYAFVARRYCLLPSGGSLGLGGHGPVLVCKGAEGPAKGAVKDLEDLEDPAKGGAAKGGAAKGGVAEGRAAEGGAAEGRAIKGGAEGLEGLHGKVIAVPGLLTTAYLLLRLAFSDFVPRVAPFDLIPHLVQSGEVEAGLLIHEGQITYEEEGLRKAWHAGEWWARETGLPLPLGVNLIRKDLGEATMEEVAKIFRNSIDYAFSHEDEAYEYAAVFGRGISLEKVRRFVKMYVNPLTLDYGEEGRKALQLLLERGYRSGIIPHKVEPEFVKVSAPAT